MLYIDKYFVKYIFIKLLVLDRENNLEIVTNKIIDTTFFAWHYANGYVNNEGNVVFEACAYKNFDSFFDLSVQ